MPMRVAVFAARRKCAKNLPKGKNRHLASLTQNFSGAGAGGDASPLSALSPLSLAPAHTQTREEDDQNEYFYQKGTKNVRPNGKRVRARLICMLKA